MIVSVPNSEVELIMTSTSTLASYERYVTLRRDHIRGETIEPAERINAMARDAVRDLETHTKAHTSDCQAMLSLADVLCDLNGYKRAERLVRSVLRATDDSQLRAQAYYLLSFLAGRKKQDESYPECSKQFYLKALECEPGHVDASRLLADHYWDGEGDIKAAVRVLHEALRHHPDSIDIMEQLGYIYNLKGKARHALKYYLRAEEFSSQPARNDYNIIVGLGKCGRWQEALARYLESEERDWKTRAPHPKTLAKLTSTTFIEILKCCATRVEAAPDDLEERVYFAMCLESIGGGYNRGLVDVLVERVDEKAPKRFELIAERMTQRINNDLVARGIYEFVPITNPWPPNWREKRQAELTPKRGEGH